MELSELLSVYREITWRANQQYGSLPSGPLGKCKSTEKHKTWTAIKIGISDVGCYVVS